MSLPLVIIQPTKNPPHYCGGLCSRGCTDIQPINRRFGENVSNKELFAIYENLICCGLPLIYNLITALLDLK